MNTSTAINSGLWEWDHDWNPKIFQINTAFICLFFVYCKMQIKAWTLQRQNTEISKQIFPEKEYWGLSTNFHIHASVIDLYIPTIGLPILLEEICRPILRLYTVNRSQTIEC
jgi:hypothetical protein